MITGSLDNVNELMPYMSLRIGAALAFLRDSDFETMEPGKYEVLGNDVYAKVENYETESATVKKVEAHKDFIDVQFVAKGRELIGVAPLTEEDVIEENLSDIDMYFYKKPQLKETDIILEKGDFLIIFPWELHRPGCSVGEKSSKVKKVIIKVRVGG
jgi:biofilm protein TabA